MKLLLDECVVHDLRRDLIDHEVVPVAEAGFGGLENGELLRAASGVFDVFLTVDRNIPFQQNLGSLEIAVIILIARGINYPDLKPLVPQVLAALDTIQPGELVRIGKNPKT